MLRPGTYRLCALCLACAACDAQVSPAYVGESLLTIEGTVSLPAGRAGTYLPALAFMTDQPNTADIMEIAAQALTADSLRLDVYEHPRSDAFRPASHQRGGEPGMAVGYLTGVVPDHPDPLRLTTTQKTTQYGCAFDECSNACAAPGCMVRKIEWCTTADDRPCYSETTYCPRYDSALELCTTLPTGEGDLALKDEAWRMLAGFSQNYLVIDLDAPAQAGSVTATLLGSSTEVPAGFGLYAIQPLSLAERALAQVCSRQAEKVAAVTYNAEHGTNHTTLGFEACFPCALIGCLDPPVEFCQGPQPELERAQNDVARDVERAKVTLGCALSDLGLSRMNDPSQTSIAVIIAQDNPPSL
jgi:hypothetical protein